MRESHTYIQKKALFLRRIKFSDGFPSQISTYIFLLNGVSLCSVLNYLLDQSPLGIHYQNGNAEQNIIFTYGSSIFFGYHAHHFMRGIHMCLCCFFFSLRLIEYHRYYFEDRNININYINHQYISYLCRMKCEIFQ